MFAVVARLAGQAEAVGVGERDAHELGLRAPIVAHAGVAVGCAGLARVRRQAGPAEAVDAAVAEAAADVRRHDDAIAGLHGHHCAADLLDDPERLVPDQHPWLRAHSSTVEMEVGAADRARGEPQQRVRRGFQLRVGDVLDRNHTRSCEDDGAHRGSAGREPRVQLRVEQRVDVIGDSDEVEPGRLGASRLREQLVRAIQLAHQAVAVRRHRGKHLSVTA